MRTVKYALVTLFLFAGVAFFYAGMGTEIPEVHSAVSLPTARRSASVSSCSRF